MQVIRIPSNSIYKIENRSLNTNVNKYVNVSYQEDTTQDGNAVTVTHQVMTDRSGKTYSLDNNTHDRSPAAYYTLNNWCNGRKSVTLQCQIGDYYTDEESPKLVITTKRKKGDKDIPKKTYYPMGVGGTYYEVPASGYKTSDGYYYYNIVSGTRAVMDKTNLVNEAEAYYVSAEKDFSSMSGDEYIPFYQSIVYKTTVFKDKQIEDISKLSYHSGSSGSGATKYYYSATELASVSDDNLKDADEYLFYDTNGTENSTRYDFKWHVSEIKVANEAEYDDVIEKIRTCKEVDNPDYDPNAPIIDYNIANYKTCHISLSGCVVWYSNEEQSKVTVCRPILVGFIKKRTATSGNAQIVTYGLNSTRDIYSIETKDTYLPMTFCYGDRVIPYEHVPDEDDPTTGIDKPIATNKDGTPVVYEVAKNTITFNGCVWQNLTLQEVQTNVAVIAYFSSTGKSIGDDTRIIYSRFLYVGDTTQVAKNIILETDNQVLYPYYIEEPGGSSDKWLYPNEIYYTAHRWNGFNRIDVNIINTGKWNLYDYDDDTLIATFDYGQDITIESINYSDNTAVLGYKNSTGQTKSVSVRCAFHNNVLFLKMTPIYREEEATTYKEEEATTS